MNFSEPFIRRPIGTTLIAIGVFLIGAVAYQLLPVASMPTVDFPTITVSANRPGADPETMAATVAAPLERRLGEIPGVTELTSRSSLGLTRISIQFDLTRNIDGAARDVQGAINAAIADLPGDLQATPSFRKSNPAAIPILILALTSKTVSPSAIYDAADTVVAQRLSQVKGVAEVSVNGAEQPSIRVRVNPNALAAMGLGLEDVRTAIANANAAGPVGVFEGTERATTIGINDQLRTASEYDPIVVRSANGTVVRLSAVASIQPGVRNNLSAGWYNTQPSVLLVITKDATANVIETVDSIFEILPDIKRYIPTDIDDLRLALRPHQNHDPRQHPRHAAHAFLVTITLVMMVVVIPVPVVGGWPATIAAGTSRLLLKNRSPAPARAMWAMPASRSTQSVADGAGESLEVGFVVDDAYRGT